MTAQTGSVPLTFLGTGNAFAPERYWNSFLIGGRALMEPSPAVLAQLKFARVDLTAIDAVFISHFHADHCFGWPFLLLEYMHRTRRERDLWVVGPPGVQQRMEDLSRLGAYSIHSTERSGFALHWLEVTEREQEAGLVRFRAVRVEHEPDLDCYGFIVEQAGLIGYSGDTRLCDGLRHLARASDVLVLECGDTHERPVTHMSPHTIRTLRGEIPGAPFILTHVDAGVDVTGIADTRIANDLETIHV